MQLNQNVCKTLAFLWFKQNTEQPREINWDEMVMNLIWIESVK